MHDILPSNKKEQNTYKQQLGINFKKLELTERKPISKDILMPFHCMIPFIQHSWNNTETDNVLVVARVKDGEGDVAKYRSDKSKS